MKQQTKHLYRRLTLALLLAAILGAGAALAQTGGGYDLTWSTIDTGGGSSTGGGYQLTGTLGQPDAAANLSSGGYSLSSGFWVEIPVEGTPEETADKIYLPLLRR